VIVGGRGGGSSTTSEIDNWVQASGTVVSSVSSSLYDLSGVAAVGA
jgi:hypothetical protein